MRIRNAALAAVAVCGTLALAACGGGHTAPASHAPAQASPPPVTSAFVAGPLGAVSGTPPDDPAALSRARDWIAAATPPPGVRPLDSPPAAAPNEPATAAACDWLVRATKWWTTDPANAASASAWLSAHPVAGLAADGTMTGPGENSAIFEHPPQKPDDSIEFEFVPDGSSVIVRVDATIVPAGAHCASGGSAQSGPANSVGR